MVGKKLVLGNWDDVSKKKDGNLLVDIIKLLLQISKKEMYLFIILADVIVVLLMLSLLLKEAQILKLLAIVMLRLMLIILIMPIVNLTIIGFIMKVK